MIFVILGPTCSGKSSLAIRLASVIDAEIINGDAFQVYEDFNIGTAKPTKEEMGLVKHHLFDFVSPNRNYNVCDYQKDIREIIARLEQNHKHIIIVGGTGMYQKAALYDFTFAEEKSVDMSEFLVKTDEELYEYLKQIDYESSLNIHPNNRKRVLRAIEIYLGSGVSKSEIESKQKHHLLYDVTFVGLNIERAKLYELIDARVDKMFEMGLVEEVKSLKEKYPLDAHAFQAIGYKELLDYFDNKISLEEAKELIKKHSRNYAKRQMTYFKHQLPVEWFDDNSQALEYMKKKVK